MFLPVFHTLVEDLENLLIYAAPKCVDRSYNPIHFLNAFLFVCSGLVFLWRISALVIFVLEQSLLQLIKFSLQFFIDVPLLLQLLVHGQVFGL